MKPLSLKSKIFLGFAAMFLVLLVSGWNSRRGVSLLNEQVERAQKAGSVSASILRFDRDVQELKGLVDRFVESGNEFDRLQVGKVHGRLKTQLATAQTMDDPELKDLFARIERHITTHATEFEKVVKEKRLRDQLLHQDLPKYAGRVEKEMSTLLSRVDQDPIDSDTRLLITQSQSQFRQSEKLFLRYFDIPNGKLVAEGQASLAKSRSALTESVGAEQGSDCLASLTQFQQAAIRAVQATRSYLHLRGVVMAGEASEIAYYSARIRELSEKKGEEISEQIQERTTEVHWVNVAVLVGAALIASAIAIGLVLAIVPPVTALTNTFNQLAAGSVVDHVPEASRRDEIGEMARAAEVFSRQNHQTRLLLDDAEKKTVELRQQAEKLEATNEELDRFAYVASHDLKSPLRGIRTLAEWIEEEMGDNIDDKSTEYLGQLQSRVGKMERLLEDLLEFSRVGRMNPKSETVDVNEMLSDVIDLVDNPTGIQIRPTNRLPVLLTIRPPLEQVFLNLIGNAVKHHDKGNEGVVEITSRELENRIEFQVKDNGPGIDQSNHQRVFQMYQRVGPGGVDGTGMGLAIVKKQVECFEGQINLESKLGEGATFTFSWPKEISEIAEQSLS